MAKQATVTAQLGHLSLEVVDWFGGLGTVVLLRVQGRHYEVDGSWDPAECVLSLEDTPRNHAAIAAWGLVAKS